jgi:hypothetical protein
MIRLSCSRTTLASRSAVVALALVAVGCAAWAGGLPRPEGAVEAAVVAPASPRVAEPRAEPRAQPRAEPRAQPRATATPAPADAAVDRQLALPPPRPATVAPLGIAIDLYRPGDFVSQATKEFCVPGALATMMNLIDRDRALRHPDQEVLNTVSRRLSTDRLKGAGSEPEGWAGTLNELGYGPYEVRSVRTREAAVVVAAEAIRDTGRPAGLLVWRGAHAWVMSGFEGVEDPADGSLAVTAVLVQDPWYPRVSSIWGSGQTPNTRIRVRDLAEDYLPWKRPTARYPEKDGQFVVVVPVAEDPPAAPESPPPTAAPDATSGAS